VKKFVIDTNLYVYAFRSQEQAVVLERFCATFTPHCYLSSVVLHELLVGANTPAKARQIHLEIARPFKRRGRLITPTHRNWVESAQILARLVREEGLELKTMPKSLVHDALLAASCQEAGLTLVTDNQDDFAQLRRFLRFEFVAPWPG
jgi:predicted nucleic acid-binding protein